MNHTLMSRLHFVQLYIDHATCDISAIIDEHNNVTFIAHVTVLTSLYRYNQWGFSPAAMSQVSPSAICETTISSNREAWGDLQFTRAPNRHVPSRTINAIQRSHQRGNLMGCIWTYAWYPVFYLDFTQCLRIISLICDPPVEYTLQIILAVIF